MVWCTVATADTRGRPRTRVLHPIWEWDGETLTGWIATNPASFKAKHLAVQPWVSCSYWHPNHDTWAAECHAEWKLDPASCEALWERFSTAPLPVGYSPTSVAAWTSLAAKTFGVLELKPWRLRVMSGSVMTERTGTVPIRSGP